MIDSCLARRQCHSAHPRFCLVVIGAPDQIFDQLDVLGRADINDWPAEHLREHLGAYEAA
jgi:hypothetical protein